MTGVANSTLAHALAPARHPAHARVRCAIMSADATTPGGNVRPESFTKSEKFALKVSTGVVMGLFVLYVVFTALFTYYEVWRFDVDTQLSTMYRIGLPPPPMPADPADKHLVVHEYLPLGVPNQVVEYSHGAWFMGSAIAFLVVYVVQLAWFVKPGTGKNRDDSGDVFLDKVAEHDQNPFVWFRLLVPFIIYFMQAAVLSAATEVWTVVLMAGAGAVFIGFLSAHEYVNDAYFRRVLKKRMASDGNDKGDLPASYHALVFALLVWLGALIVVIWHMAVTGTQQMGAYEVFPWLLYVLPLAIFLLIFFAYVLPNILHYSGAMRSVYTYQMWLIWADPIVFFLLAAVYFWQGGVYTN